jgi:GNAT superfamily N-acetyltransferase
MAVYELGGYGAIDTIDLDGLLDQKNIQDRTPWMRRDKTNSQPKIIPLKRGFDPNIETHTVRIRGDGTRIQLPFKKNFTFPTHNFGTNYEVTYPCELVAVYRHGTRKDACISIRKHGHTYYDGKREEIVATLRQITQDDAIRPPEDFDCLTFDSFAIIDGIEDYASLANLTCIPKSGPNQDITEWYQISVFEGFQGMGIGSALEKCLLEEVEALDQKLLVITGIYPHAVKWYENKGYNFYRFASSGYTEPRLRLQGHVMARVLNPSFISNQSEGHLDWTHDMNQPIIV